MALCMVCDICVCSSAGELLLCDSCRVGCDFDVRSCTGRGGWRDEAPVTTATDDVQQAADGGPFYGTHVRVNLESKSDD